jgi:hypothetical protein
MLRAFHDFQVIDKLYDWLVSKDLMTSNGYQYTDTLSKYHELNIYSTIYDKNISKQKINTKVEMEYSINIPFGASLRQVRKIMPRGTDRVYFKSEGLGRRVLLYRVKIGNQNVKIEMHFYKKSLFYYKFIFSYADATERMSLTRALINKYKLPSVDLTNHSVFDEHRNCIQVEDGIEYSISYTQMGNPFFEKIEALRVLHNEKMIANYNTHAKAVFSNL